MLLYYVTVVTVVATILISKAYGYPPTPSRRDVRCLHLCVDNLGVASCVLQAVYCKLLCCRSVCGRAGSGWHLGWLVWCVAHLGSTTSRGTTSARSGGYDIWDAADLEVRHLLHLGGRDLGAGIWQPGSGVLDVEAGVRGPGSWIRGPGSWIWEPGSWSRDLGAGIEGPGAGSGVQEPGSCRHLLNN